MAVLTTANSAALLRGYIGPKLWTDPADVTAASGAPASFSAWAYGMPPCTVAWYVSTNGGSSYAPVVGATALAYTIAQVSTEDGYRYRAVFTNPVGSVTSAAATLTVTA